MASYAKTFMLLMLVEYLLAGQISMLVFYASNSRRERANPPRFAGWSDVWTQIGDDLVALFLRFVAWPYFLHRAVFASSTGPQTND